MSRTKTSKKLIGYCGVDSGQLIITDPCYLDSFANDNFEECDENDIGEYSYSGCCSTTLSSKCGGQLVNKIGAPIGCAVAGWGGDGRFPVFAEIGSDGMVKKIVIEFNRN